MTLRTEVADGVARVTIDRPDRANAYTQQTLGELEQAFEAFEATPDVRVVVVSGTGTRAFSAGADRGELAERSPESVLRLRAAQVFARIHASPLVTLAAVNGAAVGGGFELALACDLRIAADHAQFWLPEPELGLLPAAGGLQRLPAVVGEGPAREIILGGARWSAARALARGLVSDVVAADELPLAIERWTAQVMRRDLLALELAKRSLAARAATGDSSDFDVAAQAALVARARATEADPPSSDDPESAA